MVYSSILTLIKKVNDMPPQGEIAHLEAKVEALAKEVAALKESVEDLITAWNASKGLLSVIKWLAGLASAGAIVWAAWHGNGH